MISSWQYSRCEQTLQWKCRRKTLLWGWMRVYACLDVRDLSLRLRFCVAQYFSHTHSIITVGVKIHKTIHWASATVSTRLSRGCWAGHMIWGSCSHATLPAHLCTICLILTSNSNCSQVSVFAVVKVQNAKFHGIFTSLTFFSCRWIYGSQFYSCKIYTYICTYSTAINS